MKLSIYRRVTILIAYFGCAWCALFMIGSVVAHAATRTFDDYEAMPPIHTTANVTSSPQGLTPSQVKNVYHLPANGGKGTIAIISAYHHPLLPGDLAIFNMEFNLAKCTIKNKCLEIHTMDPTTKTNSGWAMESALDAEWAHAIAPKSKILIVESKSARGGDLLSAIDYARHRDDVTAVSLSWGGPEFANETDLDKHFISDPQALNKFFASSGDDGAGASWPAVSPNVIAVGGTSLGLNSSGTFNFETAWTGSGGGVSQYEKEPPYQSAFSIPHANNMRAIPDVSYAADPAHGFSVYHAGAWFVVGGTSAGAPQWAALSTLGNGVSLTNLYKDKSGAKNGKYFRDIISGKNGDCIYYCTARKRYDYVTGLGSPVTFKF